MSHILASRWKHLPVLAKSWTGSFCLPGGLRRTYPTQNIAPLARLESCPQTFSAGSLERYMREKQKVTVSSNSRFRTVLMSTVFCQPLISQWRELEPSPSRSAPRWLERGRTQSRGVCSDHGEGRSRKARVPRPGRTPVRDRDRREGCSRSASRRRLHQLSHLPAGQGDAARGLIRAGSTPNNTNNPNNMNNSNNDNHTDLRPFETPNICLEVAESAEAGGAAAQRQAKCVARSEVEAPLPSAPPPSPGTCLECGAAADAWEGVWEGRCYPCWQSWSATPTTDEQRRFEKGPLLGAPSL